MSVGDFDISLKGLDKLRKDFDPKLVAKAETKAINDSTRDLRKHVSSSLRKRYNVDAAAVARRVTIETAKQNRPYAALIYRGHRVGLINFKAQEVRVALQQAAGSWWKKPKFGRFRTGASVIVMKGGGRKLVTNSKARGGGRSKGFIATGKNNNRHVFYRLQKVVRTGSSKGKQALRSALTWSIPEMVTNADGAVGSMESYNEYAASVYAESLTDALDQFLGGQNVNA